MIEMNERMRVRNERLALLQQQEDIQNTICSVCPFNGAGECKRCVKINCEHYEKLRDIGDKLLAISNTVKAKRRRQMLDQAKKFGMTTRIYRELSEEYEWNDYCIRSALGMTAVEFRNWKKQNGLFRARSPV